MNNIILIGMPGVGKSTVGVVLAKALGFEFVDSDLVIQKRTGRLLHELIEEKGIEGFIRLEEEINSSLAAARSVIATGGSAVYGEKAMQSLGKSGTMVYLKTSYPVLEQRLGNLMKRGVVIRPGQSLQDLFCEREPLYEKYADVVIDEEGLDIRGTVEQIMQKLEKYFND